MKPTENQMNTIISTIVKEVDNINTKHTREKKLAKYFHPEYQFAGGSSLKGEKLERKTGLASCGICLARAAYKLDRGMTFNEMKEMIHNKHPKIKDLDRYTQRFIRFVTGEGYDDWIIQHEDKMWKVRNPNIAGSEKYMSWLLGERWNKLVKNGEEIYEVVHNINTDKYTQEELNEHLVFCNAVEISKIGKNTEK